MRRLLLLSLLLPVAVHAAEAPVPRDPPLIAEPVRAAAPTLPLRGSLSRSVIVAEDNRADYAGATARNMFNMVSTTALRSQPIQAAGLPGLRYSALLPVGQGAARAIAIAFLFAPDGTHVFWAERPAGAPPGHEAELERMLREFSPP